MIWARITLGSTVVGSIVTPASAFALACARVGRPLYQAHCDRVATPERADLLDAWARYLSSPATSETSETSETNPEQDRSVGAASS